MTLSLVRRRSRALAIAVAGSALAAVLAGCGSAGSAPAAAPHFRDGGSVLDTPLSAAVEHMRFTDESGRAVRLADYTGKTIVLGDILTLCQEHCPIDTATFVQLAQQYSRTAKDPDDTVFLSITVDPARDTPAQLAAYRRTYVGAASHLPQWHLLTASPSDLKTLWSFLHVYVEKVGGDDGAGDGNAPRNWRTGQRLTYDVDHSDDIYFIGPDGRERWVFAGQPYLHGAHVPARMQRFLTAEGHRNEKKGSWTAEEGMKVLDWMHDRA
jgi:cytochrome oxidase Cu insertion factor (SCO1/SenC/PrrC family)